MKNILWVLMAIVLILPSTSCQDDFLTQDPQTKLSTEQIFQKMENIQPFVYGLYFRWRDTKVNRKGFFTLLGTDEIKQGEYQVRTDAVQAAFDRYDGFYDAENSAIAQLWTVRWPVAVQAKEGLFQIDNLLPKAVPADTVKLRLYQGQLAFYYAAVTFELTQYFGRIPLTQIKDGVPQLSGREPLDKVYADLESHLEIALKYLPSSRPADGRIPTTWAAKMLMAKIYMSAPVESGYRDFSKAKTLLEDIKNNGGFNLEEKYGNLWDPVKVAGNLPSVFSSEEIFTFYFNNVWPDCNEAQWYTGSRACSGDPNCMYGGYDLALPTDYAVGLYESGDERKDESIRTNFVYKGKQPAAVTGFGEDQLKPHIRKFEDVRIDGTKTFFNTGKNMYYFRYADALLMLAECLNELGETSIAETLVNTTVRRRAFGGTLPSDKAWSGLSQGEFRDKIMEERVRELLCEGWRRMDLVRTGKFVEYVKDRNPWAKSVGSISAKHCLFPIPNVEIKQNPYINSADQNPGF